MTHVFLSRLTKQFVSNYLVVKDLSLDIPDGKITALLGPSGCGKTTVLKMIAGLLEPTNGDIQFDGFSVLDLPAERRGAVMMFQSQLLFPYLSVGENVAFGLKMRGEPRIEIRRKVSQMLELIQMGGYEERKPAQLSGGQQQRVALARALIVKPRVLLLDEPLSSLDAYLRDEMRELIRDLQRRQGITTLFVTHDQEEAVMMGDRLALLLEGALQQVDEPRAFYEHPVNLATARFFGAKNVFRGSASGGLVHTSLGDLRFANPHFDSESLQIAIRPENIRIVDDHQGGENTVPAKILSIIFNGLQIRLKVCAKDEKFEVVTDVHTTKKIREGDQVQLYFPPEYLWGYP